MGEIAEDMIDGTCCQLCTQYFENKKKPNEVYTHNYPVVCWDCWSDLSKKERKEYQRALVDTL